MRSIVVKARDKRPTLNAQRPTSNVQLEGGRKKRRTVRAGLAFNVERRTQRGQEAAGRSRRWWGGLGFAAVRDFEALAR